MEKKKYELKCGDYAFDEAASALQKEIRRGKVKEAVYWGHVLYKAGFWKYLSRRLLVIVNEDIDDISLQTYAASLATFCNSAKKPPEEIVLSNLIMRMAEAKKSRRADCLLNLVEEMQPLKIPEYALDKHTKRGRMSLFGDGLKKFWEEGAKLVEVEKKDFCKEFYEKHGYKNPNERR